LNHEPEIKARSVPSESLQRLLARDVPPLLARLYAARGIASTEELDSTLERLAPPAQMLNLKRMAQLLAAAINDRAKLLIVADYDADGATACAVGVRALRSLGADAQYAVPDRMKHGYGLTPAIVREAAALHRPDIIITVDNGIASVEGVAEATALGIKVLITDHHLPGAELPAAWCIVNPNQPGCAFPSKHLAGVGVMFYLAMALRAELRERGAFRGRTEPRLAPLLDLVALGTVADVVKLDANNRILVQQGLQRIRTTRMTPGIAALLRVAGRDARCATTYDLAFVVAPRVNAAGRLSDMSLGIECLTTDDAARARSLAVELDRLNRERRSLEADMNEAAVAKLDDRVHRDGYTVALYDPAWHQGVVGIVASRLKDRLHRPAVAFAPAGNGEIRGSGRSIPALHLRDMLDLISKREPDLLGRFGGHAAAAGLTLRAENFERFSAAFEGTAQSLLTPTDMQRCIETDGSLHTRDINMDTGLLLRDQIWGSGFAEPRFHDDFEVLNQKIVGERHLKVKLGREGRVFGGILFGATDALPARIAAVYRLDVNEHQGTRAIQLCIEHWCERVL
jgi:single-stranded-DNA-specific exonuclease